MPTSKHSKNMHKKNKHQEPSRRAEGLKATKESMVAAQKIGQKAFMTLVEETVSQEKLMELARFLNPDLYEQVEADRGASGVCGFPLCQNEISDKYGDQMYKIRNNKVYDISVRRNFCSDVCFAASKMIKSQISVEPLYLREKLSPESLTVKIPVREHLKGLPGDIVDISGGINIPYLGQKASPRQFTSFTDVAQDGLKMCAENAEANEGGNKKDKKGNIKNNESTTSGVEVDKDKDNLTANAKDNVNFQRWRSPADKDDQPKEDTYDTVAAVLEIERFLRDWMTFESLRIILGDPYVKGMLEDLGRKWEDFDTTEGMKLSVEAKAKYIALCRKLDEEERVDGTGPDLESREVFDQPKKPLPNYQQLQEDAKKQQLKVVSFYEGNDQYKDGDDQSSETADENCKASLPLIDSYSQVEWRQSIVLEKLEKYMKPFMSISKLEESKVKSLIKELVLTFSFNPNNIIFKPGQWNFVFLLLLKMLSIRIPAIRDGIHAEEFLKFQGTLLSSFNLDAGYPDRFLQYITEVRYIIRRQSTPEVTKHQVDVTDRLQNVVVHDKVLNAGDPEVMDSTTSNQTVEPKSSSLHDLD